MFYRDLKDFPRRTASEKILRVKLLILLKIQNMMDVSDNNSGGNIKSEIMPNLQKIRIK